LIGTSLFFPSGLGLFLIQIQEKVGCTSIDVKFEQLKKALCSMRAIVVGILMVERVVQSEKAHSLIAVSDGGNVIAEREVHLEKAYPSIIVINGGNVIVLREVQS